MTMNVEGAGGTIAFLRAPEAIAPSASADTMVTYAAHNPLGDPVMSVRDYLEVTATDTPSEVLYSETRDQGEVYGLQQYEGTFTIPAGRLLPGAEYAAVVWVNCDASSLAERVDFAFTVPLE